MAELKWIKIVNDIFDDEKIKLIEALPSPDTIIVIWFKLLTLAGKCNNNGVFMMSQKIPYTDEMLAQIFRREITTVKLALQTFENYGMIELIDNVYTIPNWDKYQNTDSMEKIKEQNRLRAAKHRQRQKNLIECTTNEIESNVTSNVTVTLRNAEITQQNKKKKEDKEKDIKHITPSADKSASGDSTSTLKQVKHKHGQYKHVLLTDKELSRLVTEFGDIATQDAINYLDEYIEMKGTRYKSHYLALRKWVFGAVKEQKEKGKLQGKSQGQGKYYHEMQQREYGTNFYDNYMMNQVQKINKKI